MNFSTGSKKISWQPVMTGDTTTSSYWLNWRVLLCAIWVLMTMVFASILISKYEGSRNSRQGSREEEEEQKEAAGVLYDDEVWRTSLKGIHPAWLLAFRIVAFFVLLVLLFLNISINGGSIFYFYTQWTFALVTIYFGLGSLLSVYGCYQYHNKVGRNGNNNKHFDSKQCTHEVHTNADSNTSDADKCLDPNKEPHVYQTAGFWGYAFQIIFQINAGAVMLTDSVFWFIIVPFLEIKDYNLNFSKINMHTINAVLLFGETALNCLRFSWFRIAYFFLWTAIYVIFQWIVHACVSIWWPYIFLDLSSHFSPLWYWSLTLVHIPCYGVFALVMKMKHFFLSTRFPQSYRK